MHDEIDLEGTMKREPKHRIPQTQQTNKQQRTNTETRSTREDYKLSRFVKSKLLATIAFGHFAVHAVILPELSVFLDGKWKLESS